MNVTATGLTTLSSTAATSDKTDTGIVQTVRAGDVITLGETFTSGNGANYNQVLACAGTSGLSGNTLTVGPTDTAITCTFTNTRRTLTLRKTWVERRSQRRSDRYRHRPHESQLDSHHRQ